MGNIKSCCAYGTGSTPRQYRDDKSGLKTGQFRRSASSGAGLATHAGLDTFNGVSDNPKPNLKPPRHGESCGNLQHISEREPDDWETDPSLHPTTGTIFMEKSKQSIQSKFMFEVGKFAPNHWLAQHHFWEARSPRLVFARSV